MAKRSALIVNIHIYYEQTEMNVIIFVSLPLLISHEFYTFCINDWSHDMQEQKIYICSYLVFLSCFLVQIFEQS